MSAKISIPLDIPDVQGLNVKTNRAGDYIITVESTLKYAYWRVLHKNRDRVPGKHFWAQASHRNRVYG